MDAERLLRRYLEQRREMGEREFVLDDMSVDEALRLLGARSRGTPADGGNVGATETKTRSRSPDPPSPIPEPGTSEHGSDWRAALRAAGAEASNREGEGKRPASRTATRGEVPTEGPAKPKATVAEQAAKIEARRPPPEPPATGTPITVARDEGDDPFANQLRKIASVEALAPLIAACTRCDLHRTARNPVPGEGNPNAGLMCVGEAPGATEDELGRPFVGQAGQLLTKILSAINLSREEVFIANVLKHRPPGNRNPVPPEVTACKPYLLRQIELVRPKVILALGTFAAQSLLETKLPIGRLRGTVHSFAGIPLVVTYHPAALLRNPSWKRPAWEDVQLARRILDSAVA